MGHLHVGVDAVADHCDLVGLQAVACEDAREHVGVGLAEGDVGLAARGMLDACADRAAVDEHRGQVGRADAVGVGGDVGESLLHPPCRAAEPVVLQRHVEGRDDGVGAVVGRLGARLIPCGLEFGDHRGGSEQEEPPGRGVVGAEVVDRGQRGGVHLLARGLDAQRAELVEVVGDALRGVVREEGVSDSHLAEPLQEGLRVGEERHAHVDRAVHVEGHVADASQAAHQFVLLPDGAVAVERLCHGSMVLFDIPYGAVRCACGENFAMKSSLRSGFSIQSYAFISSCPICDGKNFFRGAVWGVSRRGGRENSPQGEKNSSIRQLFDPKVVSLSAET